jgi:hypothetical protein
MLSVGLSCLLSSTVASDYLLKPPGWYSRLTNQKTPLHLKSNVPSPNRTRVAGWRCFQGGSRAMRDPGLKPWAVLYSRFAAKSVDRPTEQRPTPTENVATNQQLRISLVETRHTWEKIAGNDH